MIKEKIQLKKTIAVIMTCIIALGMTAFQNPQTAMAESESSIITAFSALTDDISVLKVRCGTSYASLHFPCLLEAAVEGEAELLNVPVEAWSSEPEFNGDELGEYIFSPTLGEGYSLASGVYPPGITVKVIADNEAYSPAIGESEAEVKLDISLFASFPVNSNTQLQNAIAAANDGDIIEIDGNFNIDTPITINKVLTIQSSGGNQFVLTRNITGNLITINSPGGGLTLKNIIFDGNSGSIPNAAGCLVRNNAATFTMEDSAVLRNNYSNTNPGVLNYGTFIMNGGEVCENTTTSSSSNGTGVVNFAIFDMNGGEIHHNTGSNSGGGVINADQNNSVFTMYGGEIHHNQATFGGGVSHIPIVSYASGNSIFIMKGGDIHDNSASSNGGAVHIFFGKFEMLGGKIYNNNASTIPNGNGGGVFVHTAAFTMKAGEISGNTASGNGGGVHLNDPTSQFTMEKDAVISANTAKKGGGIADVSSTQNITIKGAVINNVATDPTNNTYTGGGIFVLSAAALSYITVTDTAVFSGNRAFYAYEINVTHRPTHDTHIFITQYSAANFSSAYNNYDIAYSNPAARISPLYSATYNGNGSDGGTVPIDSGSPYPSGQAVAVLSNPRVLTKTGYTFLGWNESRTATTAAYPAALPGSFTIPTQNVVFYAVWHANTYTVTYNGNGSSSGAVPVDSSPYTVGQTVNVPGNIGTPLLARTGYTFIGWDEHDNATTPTYPVPSLGSFPMPADNVTLYAVWAADLLPTYTVKFNSDGGTPIPDKINIIYSSTIAKPADPTKAGFTFVAWYKEPAKQNEWLFAIDTVTSNITLYANWKVNGSGGNYDSDNSSGNYGGNISSGNGSGAELRNPDTEKLTKPKIVLKKLHTPYISGYPDGTVKPDGFITRAEVASIFWNLTENDDKYKMATGVFSDVENERWYTQQINYLASKGILYGYGDGTFKPDRKLTRAEFCCIVTLFGNLKNERTKVFADTSPSHWAYQAITAAYASGWVNGYPDGTFKPDNFITRAEVVTIVNARLGWNFGDEYIPLDANDMYSDLKETHWAFKDMVLASIEFEYDYVEE